jgi:hypothetical protein
MKRFLNNFNHFRGCGSVTRELATINAQVMRLTVAVGDELNLEPELVMFLGFFAFRQYPEPCHVATDFSLIVRKVGVQDVHEIFFFLIGGSAVFRVAFKQCFRSA